MRQPGERARVGEEASRYAVIRARRLDELDRDVALEVAVAGAIEDARTALAEHRDDLVATDPGTHDVRILLESHRR